jgi:hypothetical protein
MKRILTALCLLLVIPLSAWSEDIVATWRHQNGNTMKLAMRDANHVRMDTGKDNYLLVNGEKEYMVSRQDGQWTAMDMDQLAGMMSRFGIQAGTTGQEANRYQSSFKDTGRTETVAGYKGSVYVAETKDEAGELIDRSEIVFSKHKDVELASKAWMSIATRLGNVVGLQTSQAIEKATKQAETSGYGGMLRVGEMTLVSIEKPSLSTTHFDLPEFVEVMEMDNRPTQGGDTSNADDSPNFAKELGEEAGNAAQDEVKENTIDEVRKGVDGLFKKLFK